GRQVVETGGSASATTIHTSGEQDVYGSASGTTVTGAGLEVIESGGAASGTNGQFGTEQIDSGGSDVGAVLGNGFTPGAQYVYGSASGATIDYGVQIFETGGIASG